VAHSTKKGKSMRIHIATDHAGLDLSHFLIEQLRLQGHEVFDHGPQDYDPLDDYPSFCINAALAVVRDQQAQIEALGIVLGGSGNGEQIAANKVNGIRAALAWNESTAKLAREHNNANVVAVGARQHSREEVLKLVELFIAEPFSHDERHERRIGKIANYEQTGEIS
jgi:ribose 5-phosphate isomerase B